MFHILALILAVITPTQPQTIYLPIVTSQVVETGVVPDWCGEVWMTVDNPLNVTLPNYAQPWVITCVSLHLDNGDVIPLADLNYCHVDQSGMVCAPTCDMGENYCAYGLGLYSSYTWVGLFDPSVSPKHAIDYMYVYRIARPSTPWYP